MMHPNMYLQRMVQAYQQGDVSVVTHEVEGLAVVLYPAHMRHHMSYRAMFKAIVYGLFATHEVGSYAFIEKLTTEQLYQFMHDLSQIQVDDTRYGHYRGSDMITVWLDMVYHMENEYAQLARTQLAACLYVDTEGHVLSNSLSFDALYTPLQAYTRHGLGVHYVYAHLHMVRDLQDTHMA